MDQVKQSKVSIVSLVLHLLGITFLALLIVLAKLGIERELDTWAIGYAQVQAAKNVITAEARSALRNSEDELNLEAELPRVKGKK